MDLITILHWVLCSRKNEFGIGKCCLKWTTIILNRTIYYAAKRHAQLQFNTISIRVLRSSVKWEKTTVYHRSSFDVIPKSADSFKCS